MTSIRSGTRQSFGPLSKGLDLDGLPARRKGAMLKLYKSNSIT